MRNLDNRLLRVEREEADRGLEKENPFSRFAHSYRGSEFVDVRFPRCERDIAPGRNAEPINASVAKGVPHYLTQPIEHLVLGPAFRDRPAYLGVVLCQPKEELT